MPQAAPIGSLDITHAGVRHRCPVAYTRPSTWRGPSSQTTRTYSRGGFILHRKILQTVHVQRIEYRRLARANSILDTNRDRPATGHVRHASSSQPRAAAGIDRE
ncbi:hypothetical protein J6590_006973 [Homalodisca vitripennis]|nr:hypothetical protein J6590_006973 [Homalodisca vitripennis]